MIVRKTERERERCVCFIDRKEMRVCLIDRERKACLFDRQRERERRVC